MEYCGAQDVILGGRKAFFLCRIFLKNEVSCTFKISNVKNIHIVKIKPDEVNH